MEEDSGVVAVPLPPSVSVLVMDKPRPVICRDEEGDVVLVVRPDFKEQDLQTLFSRLYTLKLPINLK